MPSVCEALAIEASRGGRILETLDHLDLTPFSVLVSRCGLDSEAVLEDLQGLRGQDPPHYLSLLLVRKDPEGDLPGYPLQIGESTGTDSF